MEINEHAPVKAVRSAQIRVDATTAWNKLVDIDQWPSWNKAVSSARLEGPLAPGTVFRWSSGGSSIVSTIRELQAPRVVAWTGRALGTRAVHVWNFQPVEGGVLVRTSESMEGWLVGLLRPLFQRMLERALEGGLEALKQACEKDSAP